MSIEKYPVNEPRSPNKKEESNFFFIVLLKIYFTNREVTHS